MRGLIGLVNGIVIINDQIYAKNVGKYFLSSVFEKNYSNNENDVKNAFLLLSFLRFLRNQTLCAKTMIYVRNRRSQS